MEKGGVNGAPTHLPLRRWKKENRERHRMRLLVELGCSLSVPGGKEGREQGRVYGRRRMCPGLKFARWPQAEWGKRNCRFFVNKKGTMRATFRIRVSRGVCFQLLFVFFKGARVREMSWFSIWLGSAAGWLLGTKWQENKKEKRVGRGKTKRERGGEGAELLLVIGSFGPPGAVLLPLC